MDGVTCEMFQCLKCKKKFENRSKVKYHVELHSKGSIRYPCFLCRKMYTTQDKLKAHQCQGRKEKKNKNYPGIDATDYEKLYPYWCGYCSRGMSGPSDLEVVEDNQVKCNICGRPVSLKKDLAKHGKQKNT